jgi:MFS family permease
VGQLLTGWWSDRVGRKRLIVAGMWLQALALAMTANVSSFAPWAAAAVLLGAGTALVYPTLLAVIGDIAHPSWRATAVGTYRFWRDAGFAVGAILSGILADRYGIPTAIAVVAVLTAGSGAVVAVRMRESKHDLSTQQATTA